MRPHRQATPATPAKQKVPPRWPRGQPAAAQRPPPRKEELERAAPPARTSQGLPQESENWAALPKPLQRLG